MTGERSDTDENKEKLPLLPNRELCPVEHRIIGSTTYIDGQNIIHIFKQLLSELHSGNIKAKIDLLTPVAYAQTPTEDMRNEVLALRQEDRSKKNFHSISILEPRGTVKAYKKHLNIHLELSDLDKEGLVIPFWKIYLKDNRNRVVNDREILGNQKIDDEVSSELELSDIDVEQRGDEQIFYRTISLKSRKLSF